MISATGSSRSAKAFTLVEIILVIAIMGVISGMVAVNFGLVGENFKKPPLRQILYEAVMEARLLSIESKTNVQLCFDEEQMQFELTSDDAEHYLPIDETIQSLSVSFYLRETQRPQTSPKRIVYGGDPTDCLYFTASGASTPVRVDIESETHKASFILDPFSATLEPL